MLAKSPIGPAPTGRNGRSGEDRGSGGRIPGEKNRRPEMPEPDKVAKEWQTVKTI
jgi:hypothetical protein